MKLVKGISYAVIAACLLCLCLTTLMFEADSITLHTAIRLFAILVLIFLASLGVCWVINYEESTREDWQELLKKPKNDRHR